MKVRNGFVSNSSSSSFLMYGIVAEEDDLNIKDSEDLYDIAEDLFENELTIYANDNINGIYIGASWDSIKDDETGAEFKSRIESIFKYTLKKDVKCSTIEDSWYD